MDQTDILEYVKQPEKELNFACRNRFSKISVEVYLCVSLSIRSIPNS